MFHMFYCSWDMTHCLGGRRSAAPTEPRCASRQAICPLPDLPQFSTHHSCSPFLLRILAANRFGLRLAVSKVATVIPTAPKNIRCPIKLMPTMYQLPKIIPNAIHHIHASICMIMCRVAVFGICLNGFLLWSITEHQIS